MANSGGCHQSFEFEQHEIGGVTASQGLLKDLYARLAEQEEQVNKCEEELAGLREKVDTTKADIFVMERAEQLFVEKENSEMRKKPLIEDLATEETFSKQVKYGVTEIEDLKGCRFQYQAFLRIAEMNDGEFVLSEAADLVIAALDPKGTRASVLVSQRKKMQESDEWERIARGVYRLTEFRPSRDADEASATATIDIDQDSSEKDIKPQQHAA